MSASEETAHVLLVEDDATLRDVLASELTARGFHVSVAARGDEVSAARAGEASVVLLDERLPGRNGLDVLRTLRSEGCDVPVVFLTGYGDIRLAVEAIRAGAFHFLSKPCAMDELDDVLRRAMTHSGHRRRLAGAPSSDLMLIGTSPALERLRVLIGRVAASTAPVLLTGESGTGKELVARLVHGQGGSQSRPFVALNCATLQDTLVEAELFGHERGAFTGALRSKPGLIEQAAGGTLFLDELAELTLPAQAKLLRVLEEGTFRRVGATEELTADIRLLAATNVDIPEAIAEGRFRQDLYFRLNVLELRLPPLRERTEDIVPLVQHFFVVRKRSVPSGLDEGVLSRLAEYSWPGNVRELFNVLERVLILSEPGIFDRDVLEDYLAMASAEDEVLTESPTDRLDELEMLQIHRVLERCGGNKTQAAKILGISLKTLYNKLTKERDQASGGRPTSD